MNRLAILAVALALLVVGTAAFAQSETLTVTTNKPVIDGVVNPSEYSFSKDYKNLVLYVNRTADSLYVAVVGTTKGWVAFGVGSLKMDGASIFIGFVKDGKAQFKPQAGRGNTHRNAAQEVNDSVVSSAMKETDGKTTLEVELKQALYIKAGQATMNMIYAIGVDDSFVPGHSIRGSLPLKLK